MLDNEVSVLVCCWPEYRLLDKQIQQHHGRWVGDSRIVQLLLFSECDRCTRWMYSAWRVL